MADSAFYMHRCPACGKLTPMGEGLSATGRPFRECMTCGRTEVRLASAEPGDNKFPNYGSRVWLRNGSVWALSVVIEKRDKWCFFAFPLASEGEPLTTRSWGPYYAHELGSLWKPFDEAAEVATRERMKEALYDRSVARERVSNLEALLNKHLEDAKHRSDEAAQVRLERDQLRNARDQLRHDRDACLEEIRALRLAVREGLGLSDPTYGIGLAGTTAYSPTWVRSHIQRVVRNAVSALDSQLTAEKQRSTELHTELARTGRALADARVSTECVCKQRDAQAAELARHKKLHTELVVEINTWKMQAGSFLADLQLLRDRIGRVLKAGTEAYPEEAKALQDEVCKGASLRKAAEHRADRSSRD